MITILNMKKDTIQVLIRIFIKLRKKKRNGSMKKMMKTLAF